MISNRIFRNILVAFLTTLLLLTLVLENNIVKANPLPVDCTLEIGGLLPSNISINLQMQEADVSMIIDASEYPNLFKVEFYGAYKFYNPNETTELLVGAPFMVDHFFPYFNFYEHIEPNIEIVVNEVEVNNTIYHFSDLSGWEEYINEYQFYRIFALANVTFESNLVTNLEYRWNSTIVRYDSMSALSFYYDVATGRAWSGNITETVTMSVFGIQPDLYTDYQYGLLSKSCIIEKIPGGKNYSWLWENERISDFYVGIEYDFRLVKTNTAFYSIINGILILGVVILSKRKKKERNK
ncbi:MAG: hypothetical protein H7644_03875 [Candidatus Heimdallarchaeota archaeon]|nr:hypothetical protein [Candidatus Heimdallarchaeota archaeon]MCK5142881.1 hypothetical protein [Candidatus Heimdallarchaeota archaeon]